MRLLGALTLVVALAVSAAPADTIAVYTFSQTDSPSSVDPQVTADTASRTGLSLSGTDGLYIRSNSSANDLAGALSQPDYVQFVLTPDAGLVIDFSQVTIRAQEEGATDEWEGHLALFSSQAGWASAAAVIEDKATTGGGTGTDYTFDLSSLASATDAGITFRVYYYQVVSTTRTTGKILRSYDTTWEGTLIPEPATLGLLGLGGLGLLRRRGG